MTTRIAPFGSWQSPITTEALVAQNNRIGEPQLHQGLCFWLESRPQEKGRTTIMMRTAEGQTIECLPQPINCRSKAHEYGGGSYLVADQWLFFVVFDDQRIYRTPLTALLEQATSSHNDKNPIAASFQAEPITPEGPYRHADFCYDALRQRLICVREVDPVDASDEPGGDHHEAQAQVVAYDLTHPNTEANVLCDGADFYSNPRLSPNALQLSWLSWDHPNMPWDATQCWLADMDSAGRPANTKRIAGDGQESVFQPQWSPAGELFYVSDRSNWWNLYRYNQDADDCAISPMAAEFATPQWVFGMSCYSFLDDNSIFCCFSQRGAWQAAILTGINTASVTHKNLDLQGLDVIESIQANNGQACFIAANYHKASKVYVWDKQGLNCLQADETSLDASYLSKPEAFSFSTSGDDTAHAFFYPPSHPEHPTFKAVALASDLERPPLIVLSHGGPTGATNSGLNLKIQFWTSRGFAVCDVNYRGSTGYGRQYRDKLKQHWGQLDVDDVCAAAEALANEGKADPKRLIIKGSSAGGYTVLCALTFRRTFAAGTSLYGVGDLEALAKDTHKFEARYLDSLIGPYPAEKTLYQARSPINAVDQLSSPVLFLQGLDDKVVPPNQAQAMVDALKSKGIPVAHQTYAGEGHGFRQAATIEATLDAELSFYAQLFKFEVGALKTLPDALPIFNLEA